MKLLIGTANPAKLRRYAAIVGEVIGSNPIEVLSPEAAGVKLSIVEDGATAAENARKKARAYADASELLTLGIDEALEITGLPSELQPGTHVRRYGGKQRTDEELVQLVLGAVQCLPASERRITWTFAFCLARPSGDEFVREAVVRGGIADTPASSIPEGYPLSAIFTDEATGKRVAALTQEEQRARLDPVYEAMRRLLAALDEGLLI